MGRQSRRKQERREARIGRDVADRFLRDAQPLIQAESKDGVLTIEQLQAVLDESLERDHLRAFSAGGAQREACVTLLAEAASQLGANLEEFTASFARINPDSAQGTTPVAMMAVAAENLDRWLGPRDPAAPPGVRAAIDESAFAEIGDLEAAAYEAAVSTSSRGECAGSLPRLLADFGGETLLLALIGAVSMVSTHWSASTDEYHDTHLINTLL